MAAADQSTTLVQDQIYNIYIQDTRKDNWMEALPWQISFLEDIHLNDTKEYFINGKYPYMTFPLNNLSEVTFDEYKRILNEMRVENIQAYQIPGWIPSLFGTTIVDSYLKTSPVGILCNLKTGSSRVYMFSKLTKEEMSKNHPHSKVINFKGNPMLDLLMKSSMKVHSDVSASI